jgi:hypothetical protein
MVPASPPFPEMALYAMPGAIRAGLAQFAAFGQDAIDSKPISLRASSPCLWRLEAKRRLER